MEQAKIEQLAFLYLCSEHDKRLLFKKEKMQLADFDRLTYLIYHLGFKEYHIKVWMEFAGDFKKEWDCLELRKCIELHNNKRKPISKGR